MKKVILENNNYAIIYYYDANNKSVDAKDAVKGVICEFDSNNNLIRETNFVSKIEEETDNISLEDNSDFPVFKV